MGNVTIKTCTTSYTEVNKKVKKLDVEEKFNPEKVVEVLSPKSTALQEEEKLSIKNIKTIKENVNEVASEWEPLAIATVEEKKEIPVVVVPKKTSAQKSRVKKQE